MKLSILNHIAIVLMEPKFPENIGAAARAACNMGISRLIVVGHESPDPERMAMMATHKARPVLANMEFHQTLETALAPFSRVIGTTARQGRHRIPPQTPRAVVGDILPLLPDNDIAFLFGPEDRGLSNDDLKYCHHLSAIPTADFSSLNLAQAVAIHCYELYTGILGQQKISAHTEHLATTFELEAMYQQVETSLSIIEFLREKNHAYYMNHIRQLLSRLHLRAKEASMIRSMCRQFLLSQGKELPQKNTENQDRSSGL